MIREVIGTGASIEEARAAALAELNAPEDANVTTEVLEMPEKKKLGLFGGSPAKVKASYEESDFSIAESYIRNILKGLGIEEVGIETKEEDGDIRIQLDCGDNYGAVIGRRGETLDAMQRLTRLVVNKGGEGFKRVTINVGNYRERREVTLRDLAKRNADKVKKYGRNMSLDPMNPYERRIIHTTIQSIEGVDSHSEGSDKDSDRRVVISLAEGFKPTGGYRNDRPPRRDGYKGGGRAPSGRPFGENRSDAGANRNAPQRAPRSDASSASLYGKIEPKKND